MVKQLNKVNGYVNIRAMECSSAICERNNGYNTLSLNGTQTRLEELCEPNVHEGCG